MAGFEAEYPIWLNKHKAVASGERLRRLEKRHGFGEKLLLQQCLWPVLGSLENLHPEYEFIDSDGKLLLYGLRFRTFPETNMHRIRQL